MASNLQFSVVLKNNRQAALTSTLGGNAKLNFYSGTQPASPDVAVSNQVLLATLSCSATFAPAPSGGVLTLNAISSSTGTAAAGTGLNATWFRFTTSSGVAHIDGSVGTSGCDINFSSTLISSGQPINLGSAQLAHDPGSAASGGSTFTQSENGWRITQGSGQIVDASGNVYSLASDGHAIKNGATLSTGAPGPYNLMVYLGGNVYGEDGTDWRVATPTTPWTAASNPISESSELLTLTNNTGYLADTNGNVWTLHDDSANGNGYVVYENGAPPPVINGSFTKLVTKLVYHSHRVYQVNVDGNSWYWDGTTPWNGPYADPTVAQPAAPTFNSPVQPTFYGFNGHFDYGGSGVDRQAAQMNATTYMNDINAMNDIGARTFRNGYGGNYTDNTWKDFINNYATPNGICVYPNITTGYDPTISSSQPKGDGVTATETSAYNSALSAGKDIATALKGLIPWYEIGNEDDIYALINNGATGLNNTDYDNRRFTIVRGYYRGMIDGIKSIDANAKIMNGGITWEHFAFLEMLWNGTQPDGTSGHPLVRWDITNGHFYLNNNVATDNPLNVDNGTNWLAKISEFGVPVRITEWGANYHLYGSEAAVSSALINFMTTIYNNRATYNIMGMDAYQLVDISGDTTVPLTGNGSDEMNFGAMDYQFNHKQRYTDMKNFIAAHPA